MVTGCPMPRAFRQRGTISRPAQARNSSRPRRPPHAFAWPSRHSRGGAAKDAAQLSSGWAAAVAAWLIGRRTSTRGSPAAAPTRPLKLIGWVRLGHDRTYKRNRGLGPEPRDVLRRKNDAAIIAPAAC